MGNTPESTKPWSAEEKLLAVIETASLNESEQSAWCREKGLYPEALQTFREEALSGLQKAQGKQVHLRKEQKQSKQTIRELEREIRRKDKALAETAALLVLAKKAEAIWGDGED